MRNIYLNDRSVRAKGLMIGALSCLFSLLAFAEPPVKVQQPPQNRTIIGTIVDAGDNTPVIGANVFIKETKTGAISDLDGRFTIQIPQGRRLAMEVSFIGYKTQTIDVVDQGVFNIRLESDDTVLSEVVVVGAGIQKKISVTGAISAVEGAVLKTPTSSLTNSIAGKLAGVISNVSSGEPGSTSEFYIRGISTFGGVRTPLILLDGVEISTSDLDRIPAETIASFSVLKDASATAIYGARGANGVMIVTTKDGTINSRTRINATFEGSFQTPRNKVRYVDGATWMELYNEAGLARDKAPRYSQTDIDMTRAGTYPYRYPNVDWQDLMFKNSVFNQRANVNISGGGAKLTYYMSLQVNHDTGMLDIPKTYSYDNNINRLIYIFQNNLSYSITPTTKLGLRMNAQIGNLKGPGFSTNQLFEAARNVAPVLFPAFYPAREGDKHIRFGNDFLSGSELYTNPYALMMSEFKEENFNTINTVINIEQELDFITKGLKLTGLVNFKNWSSTNYERSIEPYYYHLLTSTWDANNPDVYEMQRLGDSGEEFIRETDNGYTSNSTFYVDARLDYTRGFGDHSVSGMLMYMQRENRAGVRPNRLQGFSGRFTYDFMHKYMAEFNFGYNGSERLAAGNRFEFFPAVSVGWNISEESFWEPIKNYVSFLKIRGSYGIVGSDQMTQDAGHYLYLDNVTLSGGGYSTGYQGNVYHTGPGFQTMAIENACWERVKKLDIGVDLELFSELKITFDYFLDKRYNILMRRGSWPIMLGYFGSTPYSNIGKVRNEGLEFSVNWRKYVTKDLLVELRGNFTYNRNKYEYYDEPNYAASWRKLTGRPLSETSGYLAEGYFESQEEIDSSPSQAGLGSQVKPGDIKYRDINGDGVITGDDQVMLSPYGTMPRIQYGAGLNVVYKKLDFGVFFNGSAKRRILINNAMSAFGTRDENIMKWIADSHWSVDNPDPNAVFPRLGLSLTDIDNNTKPSSHWMRKADFLRFKTLEIGYSFPRVRLYFSGDNLAVWSPFDYWDPELSWNAYPMQRTFNFGVQFNF